MIATILASFAGGKVLYFLFHGNQAHVVGEDRKFHLLSAAMWTGVLTIMLTAVHAL